MRGEQSITPIIVATNSSNKSSFSFRFQAYKDKIIPRGNRRIEIGSAAMEGIYRLALSGLGGGVDSEFGDVFSDVRLLMNKKILEKSEKKGLKNADAINTKIHVASAIMLDAFKKERLLMLRVKVVRKYRVKKRRATPKSRMWVSPVKIRKNVAKTRLAFLKPDVAKSCK